MIGFSGAFLCVFLLIAVIMTKVCYHKITSQCFLNKIMYMCILYLNIDLIGKQGNQQQQVQEIHMYVYLCQVFRLQLNILYYITIHRYILYYICI